MKPCPYCGEQKSIEVIMPFSALRYSVYCFNCDSEGPPEDTEQEAIDAWNNRKGETELTEACKEAIHTIFDLVETEVISINLKDKANRCVVKLRKAIADTEGTKK